MLGSLLCFLGLGLVFFDFCIGFIILEIISEVWSVEVLLSDLEVLDLK